MKSEDYGSVEGVIYRISSIRSPYFLIYDKVLKKSIRCEFNESFTEKVRSAFMKKVSVSGKVYRHENGLPYKVMVEDIDIFPGKEDLPSYQEVLGILS